MTRLRRDGARFAAAGGGVGADLSRTAELTSFLPSSLDVSDADILTLEFEGDEFVDCLGFTTFDQGMAKTYISTADTRHSGWGPVLVVP